MTRKIRSFGETTIKLIFNSPTFEYHSEGDGTAPLERKVTKLLQSLHPGDASTQNNLRQQLVLIDDHTIPDRKPIEKSKSSNEHLATLKALETEKAELEDGLQQIQTKIAAKHADVAENSGIEQPKGDLALIPLHRIKGRYKAKIKQIKIKIARLTNQWNTTPINYANIYKYLDFSKRLKIEDVLPSTTKPKIIRVADLEELNANGEKFTEAEIQTLKEPMQLEIRLSKNVIRKIKAGAEIRSILIIPPKHPDHHVEANVMLEGPLHAVHPIPKSLQELPTLTPPSTPIAAIGIDMNRFPSRRAMSN
jgi:hypothetical protein